MFSLHEICVLISTENSCFSRVYVNMAMQLSLKLLDLFKIELVMNMSDKMLYHSHQTSDLSFKLCASRTEYTM